MSWLWTRPSVSDREPPSGASPDLPRAHAAGAPRHGEASVEMLDRGEEEFMGQDKGSGGNMRVDTDLIRQLADLLTEKDLSEIEVEDSDRRVVVKRNTMGRDMAAAMSRATPAAAAPAAAAIAPAPAPPAATAAAGEEAAAAHPGAVKSPMVGTVFLSPEPGAPPFVSTGDKVAAGETLLIIEAMKVMNPIAAPKAGIVKQILVQDAQPVEYDQPLVIVE